ncbi:MAG TPA: Uma2 family endonuclease, partial [Dehalococcoidia bacterium]|nr:Uma2 family endonuclease [Dehalococcoidia bacterium]
PDFAIVRPRDDFYRNSIPTAADVLLVVEVADSSLVFDRSTKASRYARAGIAEFWLVDVSGNSVEVHRNPAGDGYADVLHRRRSDTISPTAFPSVEIALNQFLS